MNLQKIKQSVSLIKATSDQDATAHSLEDDLHREFITHIADGDFGELSDMAREVLKTQNFGFTRWHG